jgi:hypothetical protein
MCSVSFWSNRRRQNRRGEATSTGLGRSLGTPGKAQVDATNLLPARLKGLSLGRIKIEHLLCQHSFLNSHGHTFNSDGDGGEIPGGWLLLPPRRELK